MLSKNKILSLLLGLILTTGTMIAAPVSAQNSFDVELEVVTEEDSTTLPGEAKVKVSITGLNADVNVVQANVTFKGDLQYKSIDYLQGKVELPDKYQTATEAATANDTNEIQAAIFSLDEPLKLNGKTELFILTFKGEAGDSVTLTLDKENTFVKSGNDKTYAKENVVSEKAVATSKANEAANAVVKIVMDKITDFAVSADQPVTLTITNERTKKSVSAVLSDDNRTGVIPLTFTVSNDVLANDTYTVELSCNGYKTYKNTGVDFKKELIITNTDFVPGDINKDNKIDDADKALYDKAIADNEYNAAADFNHDGYIDERDNVFEQVDSPKTAPEKMSKPSVSGGEEKITVSWTAPSNGGSDITGYVIKYGKSKDSLSSTETANAGATSKTISNLKEDTTYYVQIAAKNAIGTGEYSDIASATTDEEDGGGSGGGGFSPAPITPVTPVVNPNEPFTDLAGYEWAKESIYTLKNKGIISGVSSTSYAPANNIRRADFILILTRMLGINDSFTENFADVAPGSYYYNAVGSAKAAGIAQGSGNSFMPENTITRQDLITLAYRAFLAKGYIAETTDLTSLDAFADKDTISEYARTAMASMVSAGIIQGNDGKVNPLGNATRAEVAVMCARLVNLIK